MRKLFGTDGIRGKANSYPMTPEMALRIGKAIAHVLSKDNGHKHRIVIGKDTRLSGYMLETALTSGIVSSGVDVLLVGPMPTPAIAHLTKSLNCDAGIVLSASHNPAGDNGIKIFDSQGFKLPDSVESEIESVALNPELESDNFRSLNIGKAFRINDAKGRYIEFAKSSIKSMSLDSFKIVLDCANGAAYHIAPDIFLELGAEVITLNNHPDGLNINLNCGATHPEVIQQKVRESGADIGIALDGDADRLIVCDEFGEVIDGDFILSFCALEMIKRGKLNHNTLVVTDYSNLGVDDALQKVGGLVVRVQNGDRYVLESIRNGEFNLGGEASGHMIFFDHATTGDGIISALQLLRLLKNNNLKASDISKVMVKYPQVIINVDVSGKKDFDQLSNVTNIIQEIKSKLGSDGRVLVRYSGTQNVCRIMVEGKIKEQVELFANQIADIINKEVGVL